MNLTSDQVKTIQSGHSVRLAVPEVGADCVLVRADVFDRVRRLLDEELTPQDVGQLVESTMSEYDQDDSLLETYQRYRQ